MKKLFCLLLLSITAFAQRELSGSAELKLSLDKLQVLGRVLMIAAHPDDENTAVLAYFARGKKVRTGYLSLTRGEGGQNLIGSEQSDSLGVIRTQELLAARKIDGAEQFFSRAIDFGFSKTADETIAKWGRDNVMSDIVWVIRKFRPDVILFRFSGTPQDGHGQHQTSAILGKLAVDAAADPQQFPEQLKLGVEAWKTRRALFNSFSFNRQQEAEAASKPGRIQLDTGTFDPVLGRSYGEIAGLSRSQHRSQAMGAMERRGSMRDWFFVVSGEPATKDLFEGIDTSWNRVGAEDVGSLLRQASRELDIENPAKTIPLLIKARARIASMRNEWAAPKLQEIDEAIALCAGIHAELAADRFQAIPGGPLRLNANVINRSTAKASFEKLDLYGQPLQNAPAQELPYNQQVSREFPLIIPANQPFTERFWLAKPKKAGGVLYGVTDQSLIGLPDNPPLFQARFTLRVEGQAIELVRPVIHRYVDRAYGELTRPVVIVPPIAVMMPEQSFIAADSRPRTVSVALTANAIKQSGTLKLIAPSGWKVEPENQRFTLEDSGEQRTLRFSVTPPAKESTGELKAVATVGGIDYSQGVETINYPHIPPQTLFPQAVAKLVRADIRTTVRRIGYIMGAGDEVPAVLQQLGMEVTLLSPNDVARGDLAKFDTIVTGVRAWNVRADLRANQQRLLDFMTNGGTVVVQYNVQEGGGFMGGDPKLLEKMGPYPIKLSRDRVTVEEAPVTYPDPNHPLLKKPNVITPKDWEGWVQERGLYFASEWDPRYQAIFESGDPGEKPLRGGTLATKYGKGAYVFTGYAWFRQLPAGVPGGIRIFTNLLNAAEAYRETR